MNILLLVVGIVAVVVGGLVSRLRISPWWVLVPGGVATAVAALLYAPVADCKAADAQEAARDAAVPNAPDCGSCRFLSARDSPSARSSSA
jgi:hypothetical protein